MPSDPAFRDHAAASRYELQAPGGLAFMTYRDAHGHRVLVHTEVPPELQGAGVGGRLVKAVLEDARARGLHIVPACEFVKSYLERHPEYADVVAAPGAG